MSNLKYISATLTFLKKHYFVHIKYQVFEKYKVLPSAIALNSLHLLQLVLCERFLVLYLYERTVGTLISQLRQLRHRAAK